MANGIAVDNNGAAYVTGWTVSTNFPNTIDTNMPRLHSFVATNTTSFLATNVFLTKITNAMGRRMWALPGPQCSAAKAWTSAMPWPWTRQGKCL